MRIFLVVVLGLTSQQMALARGQAGVAGMVELCIAGSYLMVAVDAEGTPVGPPHPCPEAVLGLALAAALPASGVRRVSRPADTGGHDAVAQVGGRTCLVPFARGPPLWV
ncbi:MAG: hypothetical protein JJT81_08955 [Rubellimicrobium sp.]|nr:hypothetical protein [Rubellimicrobium sp.]